MLEHSLGCDPWGTVLDTHTSLSLFHALLKV
jgi:hypothetical protein